MRILAAIILWYPLFGVPAFLGCLLIWFFVRKRIQLHTTDWLLLVLPWVEWIGLSAVDGTGKSLSNLVEAIILGGATAVLFLIRSILSIKNPQLQTRWATSALAGSCFIAAALWAFVPGLPE